MKKKMKKCLAVLLVFTMLFTLVPAAAFAEESAATTPEVRYSTDGGDTWTSNSLMNAIWSCYSSQIQNVKIELLRDITLASAWYAQQDLGYNGAAWTIDGKGYTIKRAAGAKMLFCVRSGSNVTISNITIDGGAVWEGDDPATRVNTGVSCAGLNAHLIYVDGGATLTLNDGVILQNSDLGATSYGAAVVVGYSDEGNGTLIMNDGVTIRNNRAASGGAVCVMQSGDTFVMNGGTITGNYAASGGGAVFVSGGDFTMKGGEITGNASGNNGGGVGVDGTFTLEKGSITSNKSVAGGGGITALNGAVALKGGKISSNSITGKMGGGILVHNGTLTVSGTPIVNNNTINGTAASNIYLNNKKITVSNALAEGASMGVTTATVPTDNAPVDITGTNSSDYSTCFTSDSINYIIENSEDNVVQLGIRPPSTVTFDAGGGTGTMEAVSGIAGAYELPDCSFTAPKCKKFKAWSVGGEEKAAGDTITVIADTTVTAVWEDKHTPSAAKRENEKAATCKEAGSYEEVVYCSGCGIEISRTENTIDKLTTHTYGNDSKCDICGYEKPSSGGGFSGFYNYPVGADDVNGADVTLSDEYAVAGETVIITAKPDAGRQVDEVIVTDADGDVIPVTKVGDNKYSFIMPEGKVNVSVTTEAADYDKRIVMQIHNKNILVDNRTITSDVAPVIAGDRTMVPIRVVTETLGGTADWDKATRTVTLKIDGKVLTMTIGKEIPGFDVAPVIINDRTYVPIRYVAEKLGANVEWIAATQQIIIEK